MSEGPLQEPWGALTGDATPAVDVDVDGPPEPLPSAFAVGALATGAIGASLVAASALAAQRDERAPEPVSLDTRHAAVAIRSERYARFDGEPAGGGFAPLSRFWATADGWIRLHANYPWHRDRALQVLDVDDDPDAVGAAIATRETEELETAIVAAGGCAAAVRTPDEWRAHPQGAVLDVLPLLELDRIGDAPPRPRARATGAADDIRVLDLTRVIAGPVCTRTLAAHGADVLRVDTPALPEIDGQLLDPLAAKRSTLLDLASPNGDAHLEALLAGADVVVTGYRPGALEGFGLAPAALAARHPGLVVLTLSAWGHEGPWAGRRGFDSLVQAASGIAAGEAAAAGRDVGAGEEPGVLPAQALDHATGYLAAAAVLVALARQATEGGTWHARCSLAQTAAWLARLGPGRGPDAEPGAEPVDPAPYLVDLDLGDATITLVAPPGAIGGRALVWPSPPGRYGAAAARWRGAPPGAVWAASG